MGKNPFLKKIVMSSATIALLLSVVSPFSVFAESAADKSTVNSFKCKPSLPPYITPTFPVECY